MNHDEARTRLVLDLYGELSTSERRELDAYIERHPELREDRDAYARTLADMDTRERPDPGDLFWHTFADRVEERLSTSGTVPRSSRRSAPLWTALGAAAVLAIGFFAGRASKETIAPPRVQTAASPTGLDTRTATYLARTETILLGFANAAAGRIDLDAPKDLSARLLADGDAIRRDMSDADAAQIADLIADLQAVLRQIANLEGSQDALGLDLVRAGVTDGDLLFRINLEQIRAIRTEASRTATAASRQRL